VGRRVVSIGFGGLFQRVIVLRCGCSAALDFFSKVKDVAEAEGHHPDLHLTGYRNVEVRLLASLSSPKPS
jgi:Pterin 4 alpha carbinolamine dehydratase